MPKYQCEDVELGEYTRREVMASSAREAAERFAADRDRRHVEYPAESTVLVKDGAGVVGCYRVELRNEPVYLARPIQARGLKLFQE